MRDFFFTSLREFRAYIEDSLAFQRHDFSHRSLVDATRDESNRADQLQTQDRSVLPSVFNQANLCGGCCWWLCFSHCRHTRTNRRSFVCVSPAG